MALAKCKECGHEISKKADACPNCGAKPPKGKPVAIGCLAILGLSVILSIVIIMATGGDDKPRAQDDLDAYVMSWKFVKLKLKAPDSAEFPRSGDQQVSISHLDKDIWQVIGFVDAQNSFNVKIRTYYKCKLKYVGDDNWQCLDLATQENPYF